MIVQRYIRKRSVFSKAILINRKIGRMDMAASSDSIELCILIFQIAFMKQDYVFSFSLLEASQSSVMLSLSEYVAFFGKRILVEHFA